jgi:aldehyde:ferredoxin oxidoreductase
LTTSNAEIGWAAARIQIPQYLRAQRVPAAQGKSVMPEGEALRRNYYEQMGWDPETGKPLPETLMNLGLESLIPGLKAR